VRELNHFPGETKAMADDYVTTGSIYSVMPVMD